MCADESILCAQMSPFPGDYLKRSKWHTWTWYELKAAWVYHCQCEGDYSGQFSLAIWKLQEWKIIWEKYQKGEIVYVVIAQASQSSLKKWRDARPADKEGLVGMRPETLPTTFKRPLEVWTLPSDFAKLKRLEAVQMKAGGECFAGEPWHCACHHKASVWYGRLFASQWGEALRGAA